jgi:hypothetical protein
MLGEGTALGQNLFVRSEPNVMDALITDFLAKVRVGNPKRDTIFALQAMNVKALISWSLRNNEMFGNEPRRTDQDRFDTRSETEFATGLLS